MRLALGFIASLTSSNCLRARLVAVSLEILRGFRGLSLLVVTDRTAKVIPDELPTPGPATCLTDQCATILPAPVKYYRTENM